MLLIKLAMRNITHAGIRTWLNIIVLSVAFVSIVLTEGFYEGAAWQIRDTEIDINIGGGQFWQKNYDPFNPFSIDSSHAVISDILKDEIAKDNAAALLIVQAAIFPRNRIQSVLIKGIDPDQQVINIPTQLLKDYTDNNSIPGLVGSRMAKNSGLNKGDYLTIRFKNVNETFDAADIEIKNIIDINTPLADRNLIWVPIKDLQNIIQAPEEATIVILKKNIKKIPTSDGEWIFRNQNYLLDDLNKEIENKRIYSTFLYILLIGMALVAIFDTQILSIFKRRKEIGTLLALGMTKIKIIFLFTFEGALTGFLALLTGSFYGIPLLNYLTDEGILLPKMTQQSQFALGLILYPKYSFKLYLITAIILFFTVVIVSFIPVRKMTRVKPTDALRGKM